MWFHLCVASRICKSVETESRCVVASGWGSGGWRETAGGYGIFFGGGGECDEIVLELDSIDDCTTFNILKTNEFYTLKG